jgi:copper chaperone CopZ
MVETRFNVGMTCEGCASAVKRILGKVDGTLPPSKKITAPMLSFFGEDFFSTGQHEI